MAATVIGYNDYYPGMPSDFDRSVTSNLRSTVKAVRDKMEEGYQAIGVVGRNGEVRGVFQREGDVEGWASTYELIRPSQKYTFRYYARMFSHREDLYGSRPSWM